MSDNTIMSNANYECIYSVMNKHAILIVKHQHALRGGQHTSVNMFDIGFEYIVSIGWIVGIDIVCLLIGIRVF